MVQLRFGDIVIDVEQKNIKHVYLRVYPPDGRVAISAPLRMELDAIRVYALLKLSWIKKQRAKFIYQDIAVPNEYISGETHYYSGKSYVLQVVEQAAPPRIELKSGVMMLYVRPGTSPQKRQKVLNEWYRAQLKSAVPPLIEKWEKKMGVKVDEFGIKKMKTRWGTCNPGAKRIWLNLELAKKPPEHLEYIVVHEMVHLLERKHNHRFIAYMDNFMPSWRYYKDGLNRFPAATT